MKNNFLIIVTGYNCEAFVEKCFESILSQSYPDFKAIFISDGSTDATAEQIEKMIEKYSEDKFIEMNHLLNRGAAKRRYDAISKYGQSENDIIVLVGMDDELLPGALERIHQEYEQGKWMTYGNWINQHGFTLPADFDLDFDEDTHNARNYRAVRFRSTAPNTFRKFLLDKISPNDFIIDGKWIMQTTESPIMFACMEMCGRERIGVIKEPIYLYNQRGKQSAKKRLGGDNQKAIYKHIINIPKYPLYASIKECLA